MGNSLDFWYVLFSMLAIVVFSIILEFGLERLHHRIEHFNPLFKPCVEKVTNELMILGAISFVLVVANDVTNLKKYPWEHTLHWVDNTSALHSLVKGVSKNQAIDRACSPWPISCPF